MDFAGKKKKFLVLILSVLVFLAVFFVYWGATTYDAQDEALSYMTSNESVEVISDRWITFSSVENTENKGMIFYPGGKVDPRAYTPLCYEIAERGYFVVILPMPLHLPVLAPMKASKVIESNENINSWAIGGHSLGGSMAAKFASNSDSVDALFMLAAYPPENIDLSDEKIEVISIYGTNDKVLNMEKLESRKDLLPTDTDWVVLEGGNHSQFGYYGIQDGDGKATMSRFEQQKRTLNALLDFMRNLDGD